ncbi:MAG TPA: hypothetical protein VGS28_02465 [Candidatus Saccharimonadales bacterium]|nr:hypothetical protein [Candidatus Saccharimonadales bacterium]
MADNKNTQVRSEQTRSIKANRTVINKSSHGLWFLGFIGALIYYLHVHSGTFWLVILAFLKALVWPAFLVYHLLLFLKM